jgi:N-methylhydantoinase B/oxoprolinase/acetone carboxylase alpha subunit
VLFHRDDPKTSKSCPGHRVKKPWILDLIAAANANTLDVRTLHNTVNEKQFVKVSEYLQNIKKYSSEDIKKLLKRDADGLFYFGEEWLEDAYYDAKQQTTMAAIKELYNLPQKK